LMRRRSASYGLEQAVTGEGVDVAEGIRGMIPK
jgi:hypothetical protein